VVGSDNREDLFDEVVEGGGIDRAQELQKRDLRMLLDFVLFGVVYIVVVIYTVLHVFQELFLKVETFGGCRKSYLSYDVIIKSPTTNGYT
jgi:hypothetical protein